MKQQLIPFTPDEHRVVEEDFRLWMHTLEMIARLKGIRGQFALAPDRSGLVVGAPESDVPAGDEPETPKQ